jgi:hypothetical protein
MGVRNYRGTYQEIVRVERLGSLKSRFRLTQPSKNNSVKGMLGNESDF